MEQVHYLQSQAWAKVKEKYGWNTENFSCKQIDAGNITVYSRLVVGLGRLLYMPCVTGINVRNAKAITEKLMSSYFKDGFAIRLELSQSYDQNLLDEMLKIGWVKAKSHVQYRYTIKIDLTKSEEDVWMSFKSRGRYEVLQAQKAGVVAKIVEPTDDNLARMYELMQITSSRNKFFIRDKDFTFAYWRKFRDIGHLKLCFAYLGNELLAGSVVLTNGHEAWNKDGGSTRTKSNLMAPRLVQWEMMKQLKRVGIKTYDLGGIPNPDSLDTSSMPGIYIFKSGFSKEHTVLMPTLELPLGVGYKLWPRAERQWLRLYNLFAHNLWW